MLFNELFIVVLAGMVYDDSNIKRLSSIANRRSVSVIVAPNDLEVSCDDDDGVAVDDDSGCNGNGNDGDNVILSGKRNGVVSNSTGIALRNVGVAAANIRRPHREHMAAAAAR